MKQKNKVTAILMICAVFFFAMVFMTTDSKKMNEKKELKTDALEVANQSNITNVPEVTNVITTPPIQTLKEEEPVVIPEEAEECIEDLITTTLSIQAPEFKCDFVLPKVNEFLNIRSEANATSEIVGKLYKNSYAMIIERQDEWTKIQSGSVTGYAKNEYLYFDEEADSIAKNLFAYKIKITAEKVNVRTAPSLEGEILTTANKEDKFYHVLELDCDGWRGIRYDDQTVAYVSSQYSKAYIDLKTAVSKEEEEAIRKKKELEKALQEAKKHKPAKTNREAITVSDEDLFLLATVVAMEAVGESYEGQLAVANVVINRMLDGYWGDTIPEVVYAKGQFSGANSGRVEQFESRVTESCKKAAVEALAGNNNIGDYMFFIMNNKAKYSQYKKYYILGCHCFYSRT